MKPVKDGSGSKTKQSGPEDYVLSLQARFGQYARPAAETRRIVDESMGGAALTELLYKSRRESA
jgi:hypothetical protein